ncbi:hypothetical protein AB0M36_35665 [Actinoplanes sp. NPDC051346]|uniref:hypothetical protein n=1 Tax=Actinoplanes sp. NPDC051346 TaxID=3155048 RepID=UPI003418EB02
MRLGHLAVGLSLLSPLMATACGDDASSSKVLVYSCCKKEDLDKAYRPGETVSLHWVAEEKERQPSAGSTELTARIVGPTGSSDSSVSLRLTAPPVKVSGSAGTPPVIEIQIPRDATPGNYSVSHTRRGGGENVTGEATIKIVAG